MTGFPFKEVIEVGGIFKTKGIGNIGNVPVCVLQERPGFADDAFTNVVGSGFAGYIFYGTV
jgi:hypothetical protein